LEIASKFKTRWNFDNCVGALDGKHIVITSPLNSGSTYYNYKHTFSIVLLALVDSDYKFTYVDIGTNGRVSDRGVFAKSALAAALQDNSLHFPSDQPLPGRQKPQPYVIVADEAFPLKANIMKPFSGKCLTNVERRVFNYRLSRARRIVENTFGILANRFRVFLTRIPLAPKKVEKIVLASCALHNFLRVRATSHPNGSSLFDDLLDREDEATGTVVPGVWREITGNGCWQSISHEGAKKSATYATEVREEFCSYFNNEGSVPWQATMLREY
jgi:hypothetical protein